MIKIFFYAIITTLIVSCSYLPEKDKLNFNYVQQETNDYVLLSQQNKVSDTCFVFVPGGLVDPHVYMCWLSKIVEKNENLNVLLIKIPSNLAIINSGRIEKVIAKFPDVKVWIIGGHSLGGVVAAGEVFKNQDKFKGLVLMASWPIASNSLIDWKGNVLSISASLDGLATPADVDTNKAYLPTEIDIDTNYVFSKTQNKTYYFQIQGGNHSGFGCYGLQSGDNQADIQPDEQQKQFVEAITKFVKSI